MKMTLKGTTLTALLALGALGEHNATAGEPVMRREEQQLVSVTATIKAIDLAKREIVFQGPAGDEMTFIVSDKVKRLNKAKVGDKVTANYYVSVAGEFRPPTEEEKAHPISLVSAGARSPDSHAPAGAIGRTVKVVTKVVGLDLLKETATLQGPLGDCAHVRASNVDNLKKIRLGDNIVVTYTEALVISLDKPKAAADHN